MDTDELSEYMTVTKAAQMLGCQRSNVFYHIKTSKRLKAVFYDNIGTWLIHKDDLEAFRYGHYVAREGSNDE